MADDDKLTNNTDEASIGDLFDASLVYEVPYFQRPYKWNKAKLEKFQEDLDSLLIGEDNQDLHFMGAIIVQGRRTAPAAARPYQVIDGQQRLTTVFLHLLAAVRVLIESDEIQRAKALFLAYLVTRSETGNKSNLRMSPSGQDREALNNVINEILSLKDFRSGLDGFVFKPLAVGQGHKSDRITKNFKIALSYMRASFAEGGKDRIEHLVSAMVQRMTVVQIDIKNALDGPKIFDSLNSAQEKMTVGELVKNDIFSRGMDSAEAEIEVLENNVWAPFFGKFPDAKLFDEYFFPFGLFHNPTWRKSEVYSELQRDWKNRNLTPKDIIGELAETQPDYLEIATGTPQCGHPAGVTEAIRRLHDSNSPSSVYPFVMHVSHAVRSNALDASVASGLLNQLESFLVRRAICGLEPTGLHAVFKGLWNEIQDVPAELMISKMDEVIRSRQTVQWPSAQEVADKLRSRRLYGSRITRYVLREFDISLGGDHAAVEFQIEHVLPQSPPAQSPWRKTFTDEERAELVDTIGNLTLVSQEMNQEVSNQGFSVKRPIFVSDAMFKSTRQLGLDNEEWTPVSIQLRSDLIAEWAISRWPI